jgi:hypothetical protein
MRVAALICPNGLGHFRRVVRILSRLHQIVDDLSIDLLCEQWQLDRTAHGVETNALLAAGARTHCGVLTPGVTWSSDPNEYRDGRLLSWEEQLVECAPLRAADFVLSDNLAGTLSARSDAVMSGSFLWSDVLSSAYPDDPNVTAFAGHERELMTAHTPPMLCVDDLAMPGIAAFTERIGLPWMCDRVGVPTKKSQPRIAVLGGATGSDDALLRARIAALSGARDYALALPRNLLAASPRATLFEHTPAEYASLSAVVCRPGVGTITDCVSTGVPLVCVYDPNNAELSHNARCIESLGIGKNVGRGSTEDVERAVVELTDPAAASALEQSFKSLRTGGAESAARWLADYWGGRRSGAPPRVETQGMKGEHRST